jgi:integrase
MNNRRSNHEGTYTLRADGRHVYKLRWDGKRHEFYGRTKTEARTKMREGIRRLEEAKPAKDSTATLAEWLAWWKEEPLDGRSSKRGPLKESTKENYRDMARLYIENDAIGATRLDKLKKTHVEAWVARMRVAKHKESTTRTAYHVLRLALESAVDDELLATNPAAKVARPTPSDEEARHLSPDELRLFLTVVKSYRYHAALELIAATGMRRGEALALKWSDLDLVEGIVHVRGTLARIDGGLAVTTTKTKKSNRDYPLAPSVVDILARHKDEQEREAKALRGVQIMRFGKALDAYENTGYVFTTETGQPVDGRTVLRTMHAAAKKAKLDGVCIHTLRHSWASAMVNSGEPLTAVQDLLGHSDIRTTQRYLHGDAEVTKATATKMADMIGI